MGLVFVIGIVVVCCIVVPVTAFVPPMGTVLIVSPFATVALRFPLCLHRHIGIKMMRSKPTTPPIMPPIRAPRLELDLLLE